MRRRRFVLGALSMGYGKAVAAFGQLLLVPVLANAWGVALYGQWLMLATIPVFLAASDLGFGVAAGNRLIGQVARQEFDLAQRTFDSALLIIVSSSAMIAAAAISLSLLLPERGLEAAHGMSGDDARKVLQILICYGAVALQGGLFMAVMRSEGAFARSTALEATVQLAEAVAVAVVAHWGHGPLPAAYALLTVRGAGLVCHVLLAHWHASWLRLWPEGISRSVMQSLLRPALAAMLLPLAMAGLLQGTALAIGAAIGAGAVPVFVSLRTLSRLGLQIVMTVNLPVLPEFTAEYARGNREWIIRIAGGLASFNALAGFLGAIVLVAMGNRLLGFWTQGAIQAPVPMLWIAGAAIVASMIWSPLSYLLVAANSHEQFTIVLAASVILAVPTTYLVSKFAGLTGAAAVTLGFELVLLGYALQQSRNKFGPFTIGPGSILALLRGWNGKGGATRC